MGNEGLLSILCGRGRGEYARCSRRRVRGPSVRSISDEHCKQVLQVGDALSALRRFGSCPSNFGQRLGHFLLRILPCRFHREIVNMTLVRSPGTRTRRRRRWCTVTARAVVATTTDAARPLHHRWSCDSGAWHTQPRPSSVYSALRANIASWLHVEYTPVSRKSLF